MEIGLLKYLLVAISLLLISFLGIILNRTNIIIIFIIALSPLGFSTYFNNTKKKIHEYIIFRKDRDLVFYKNL